MSDPEQDIEFEYALAAMDDRLAPCNTDEIVLGTCLDLGRLITTAERGIILLRGEGREDWKVAACYGIEPAVIWTSAEISRTIIRTAFERSEAVLSDNAVTDKRFEESTSVVLSSLRSVMCVPFRTRGTVVAAIYLDNRFQKGAFTPRQFELIKQLAAKGAARLSHMGSMTRKDTPGGGWTDRWRRT